MGDRGTDVLALAKVLVGAGLLSESAVDQQFGRGLDAAVRKFQDRAGQQTDGVFAPENVVYVPDDFGLIASVSAARGHVVSDTWPLMTGTESIANLSIQSATDGAPLQDVDGAVIVVVGGRRFELPSITPNTTDAAPLATALREGVRSGTITATSSEMDSASIHQYSGALIETGDASSHGSVPSSAIYTAISGQSCLFTRPDRTGATADMLPLSSVSVDSAGIGQTLVDALLIGKQVIRDPTRLPASDLARCR